MPNSILRFPLPLSGLNTVNPYTDYDSGFARELTNLAIFNGRLFLRPPVRSFAFNPALAGGPRIRWFDPNGTQQCILNNGSLLTYLTGVVTLGAGTFTFSAAQPTEVTFSGTGTTLNLVVGVSRAANPTTPITKFAPFNSSGPAASATLGSPRVACSHKGRLYYASGTRIEFGAIGQVSGAIPAANFVDIEQFMNGQTISRIFSVSLSPGLAPSQNVFVVFGSDGRVLVFEGDNPSSATWNMIAAYDMPMPIGRRAYVEIDGDIFVATSSYAYWFRDLFAGGAQGAYQNSPSVPVENLWQHFSWTLPGSEPETGHIFYYPLLDAIVCQCAEKQSLSKVVNYQNEAVCLVYFRKYRAWALWAGTPFFYPIINSQGDLYGTGYQAAIFKMHNDITLRRADSYVDLDGVYSLKEIRVESSWKTPYAFLDKGIGLTLKSARAWVEVQESITTASIYKSRAIFDYSDLNAPFGFFTQSTVLPINPGRYTECTTFIKEISSAQYNPLLQLGGDGGGVSMQISFRGYGFPDPGYSEPYQHSIYGLSALVQPGSEIF
jgi:hypothetical protein